MKLIPNNFKMIKDIVELVVSNIVMARTAIQRNASANKVTKLSYQVRDPFRIFQYTGRGVYLSRELYKPNSLKLKFMVTDLYLSSFLKVV